MENPETTRTLFTGWTREEVDSYQDTWDRFLAYCREEWLEGRLELTELRQWPCQWCGEAFHSEGILASHYYSEHQVSPSSYPITPHHYLDYMSLVSEWEEGREDDSGQPPSPTGMETEARPERREKPRPAGKGFPCKRCQEVFLSVKTLASHFSRVHGTSKHKASSAAVPATSSSTATFSSATVSPIAVYSTSSPATAVFSSTSSTAVSSTTSSTAVSFTFSSRPLTTTSRPLSHSRKNLPVPQTRKSTTFIRPRPYRLPSKTQSTPLASR